MNAPSAPVTLRPLDAAVATARLDQLAAILVDAVAHGASVNFLAGFGLPAAAAFWRALLPGIAGGRTILIVAEDGGAIVGTVLLSLAPQPNAQHRADVGKMLVHSSRRRQGLGTRLLAAAEETAHRLGRTLLILDRETGSAGEHLYRSTGWTPFGVVPGHAHRPDGTPAPTTFFYKHLP